jgi:hypothetical protein
MAERTGFEPVEGLLAPHRFSKPAHSTTLPSLLYLHPIQSPIYVVVNKKRMWDYYFI